jgi:hypothetical protein
VQRLRQAFKCKDLDFQIQADSRNPFENDQHRFDAHVERMCLAHLLVIQQYAESLWNQEFGGIEFECSDVGMSL